MLRLEWLINLFLSGLYKFLPAHSIFTLHDVQQGKLKLNAITNSMQENKYIYLQYNKQAYMNSSMTLM